MSCAFCKAGSFEKDLTSNEILEQLSAAIEIAGKPTSIVFMGTGEPMLNFENVSKAIHTIHELFQISYKKITLSTCGINLNKLADVPYLVAISLHSAEDSKRLKLMPGAARVDDIVKFTKTQSLKKSGVMLEYALIENINDSKEDVEKLLNLEWPQNTNFNLIEFNPHNSMKKSTRAEEIKQRIIDRGFKCFIRTSRGADVGAACGMLDNPS